MSKSDEFYFKNFVECATITTKTAECLQGILSAFGANLMSAQVKQIHEIEHRGDLIRHELVSRITKDFITPLERDDIVKLSNAIDDITDSIEDIAIHLYINNETIIREDCFDFTRLLIKICGKVKELLVELPNFRKSKILQSMVAEIHRIEEDGDELYMKAMKTLHSQVTSPLTIIAWREIYILFEKCYDTCADVADIVESVAISNI